MKFIILFLVVDGGYSEWSEYSECSAECGEGFKERDRACNNPVPSNGGQGCERLGEATETKACKIKECPSKYLLPTIKILLVYFVFIIPVNLYT